ncbi:MAG: MarR family transcriptional regulator [Bacteroidales bacterium]|nr:MarR family transcriptional regulator [Bacteroidales bacterium]MBN2819599.1 MarR family transcriptional regulator [Bacteroidales bacterium]
MDTTEVLIRIRKIVRSINLESKKIQKEHGVSIPQVLCLNFLKSAKNYQSTQGEIRKFLNLNSSTISGIIDRLEKKGYLARLPNLSDKRVVNIALTAAGDKLLEKLPPLLHEQLSERLQKIDIGKLQQIEQSLDLLVNMLDLQGMEALPLIVIDGDLEDENNL